MPRSKKVALIFPPESKCSNNLPLLFGRSRRRSRQKLGVKGQTTDITLGAPYDL
jgi:hypothetical protein